MCSYSYKTYLGSLKIVCFEYAHVLFANIRNTIRARMLRTIITTSDFKKYYISLKKNIICNERFERTIQAVTDEKINSKNHEANASDFRVCCYSLEDGNFESNMINTLLGVTESSFFKSF